MKNEKWVKDYVTLRGKEIPLKIGYLNQVDLKFFPENPRIYSIISELDREPSQEEIEKILLQRDHVRQLIQSIDANGGLTDPIFVLGKSLVVLEGNSRLAAYRFLANRDAIKWGKIKCKVLPEEIDEDKIFALLGEYHIIGKQDWSPYEQAGYLYRRCRIHDNLPQEIAAGLGLTVRTINLLINVYSYMIEQNDNDPSRWSYYYEYLKSNVIKKAREKYEKLNELIVKKIKSGEISQAKEVRDELPLIIKGGKKIIKSFLLEKHDFKQSVERALSGGADLHCFNYISKFRHWVVQPEIQEEVVSLPHNVINKIKFEFNKIKQGIEYLEKQLNRD